MERIEFLKRNRLNLKRAIKWIPSETPQWHKAHNCIMEINAELRELEKSNAKAITR